MKRGREHTLSFIYEGSTDILVSSRFYQLYISHHQIALITTVALWLYLVASHRLTFFLLSRMNKLIMDVVSGLMVSLWTNGQVHFIKLLKPLTSGALTLHLLTQFRISSNLNRSLSADFILFLRYHVRP